MTRPTLAPALSGLLGAWLPRQRWFPVKSRRVHLRAGGRPAPRDRHGQGAGGAAFEVLLLAVSYPTPGGSRTDVVQVPLSFRPEPLPGAERALIGELPGTRTDAAHRWVYDGVHDAVLRRRLAGAHAPRRAATPSGNATGHLVESGYRLPFATGKVKVLSGEQSNSSVIVDDETAAQPPS